MIENYTWMLRIIQSCENQFQLDTCPILVELFNNKHENFNLTQKLYGAIDIKDLELFQQTLAA